MSATYRSRFAADCDERQECVMGPTPPDSCTTALVQRAFIGRTAELGCGAGFFSATLVDRTDSLVASDLSRDQVEASAKCLGGHPCVTLQGEDCTATSFEDGAFDSVAVTNLRHVIEDPSVVLQENHRIFPSEGRVVAVSFSNLGVRVWETVKLATRFMRTWGGAPEHTHVFSPDDMRCLLEDMGSEVGEVGLLHEKTKAVFAVAHQREGGVS